MTPIGVIADDYTGASDIANTLAKGGLATVQLLGVPREPLPVSAEALVVALKSRSIPAAEAVEQSLAALDWLRSVGCGQIVFKVCSTFDSTPAGNIGPVAAALAERLGARGVPVCPAFPGAGRTVYQGHLFVNDRLLSESGLENHPLNPMTDPDIRRWLQRQTSERVGFIPLPVVSRGVEALRAALGKAGAAGFAFVVVDAVQDDDLVAIGRAARDAPLLVGGSGIALGLPDEIASASDQAGRSAFRPAPGPEAILAGSCSGATLGQIEQHSRAHPTLAISADAVMAGRTVPQDVVAFVRGHQGASPLVYTSQPPGEVAALQARHGRDALAARLDAFFAEAARGLVADGVTRLVVAGGETSGAVVSALELTALAVGPEIDPGVPVLSAVGGAPLALALKSGNFGGPDFFAKALAMMERA